MLLKEFGRIVQESWDAISWHFDSVESEDFISHV
jgi:hypothetical protein